MSIEPNKLSKNAIAPIEMLKTEMHRTIKLELKKTQLRTTKQTRTETKLENRLKCRTKKEAKHVLGISYEYGDERKKNLWRWMLWCVVHAT